MDKCECLIDSEGVLGTNVGLRDKCECLMDKCECLMDSEGVSWTVRVSHGQVGGVSWTSVGVSGTSVSWGQA